MNKYIKNPCNYTGGKHKLLPQIMKHFPKNIHTFVDLFSGGGDVFINVEAKEIIANDKEWRLISVFNSMLENEDMYDVLLEIMHSYELSKTNKKAYYRFRDRFNDKIENNVFDPYLFYLLICHSFSNQIRFNQKNLFNLPFGGRTFNETMRHNFKKFTEALRKKNITFLDFDFRNMAKILNNLDSDDLLYIDSPYRISTATYNERNGWTEKDDSDLFMLLDELSKDGIRWAMSNVTHHKGRENELLTEFIKLYNVHEIKSDYNNCNYQQKNKNFTTREVLVTNYE